jgi:hypothetical protein
MMGLTMEFLTTNVGKKPVFEKFTMDRYNSIVKYKTAYYSFILPVALGMYMVCTISVLTVVIHYLELCHINRFNRYFLWQRI